METSADDFIRAITLELDKGYSFLPILGSSISYQSGIPSTEEVGHYLCYVYYITFIDKKWDFINDGWPDFPNEEDREKCKEKIYEIYRYKCSALKIEVWQNTENNNHSLFIKHISNKIRESEVKPDNESSNAQYSDGRINISNGMQDNSTGLGDIDHPHYFGSHIHRPLCPAILEKSSQLEKEDENLKIIWQSIKGKKIRKNIIKTESSQSVEEGFYSLHNWNESLEFFSKIKKDKNNNYFLSKKKNKNIYDSFNKFIIENKKPNQNHHLIAHLARPMRFRKIVTTNLDNLLEDALLKNKQKPKIIFPYKNKEIPSHETINKPISILKLNTINDKKDIRSKTKRETRIKNKKEFSKYLNSEKTSPSHLFIIGDYEKSEPIIERILYAIQENTELKIFIITSHKESKENKGDLKEILLTKIEEDFKDNFEAMEKIRNNILIRFNDDPSFFLAEIYQRLTLSLPPGGFFYQYAQNLPPKFHETEKESKKIKDIKEKIFSQIIKKPKKEENTLLLIRGRLEATKLGAHLFYKLTKLNNFKNKAVWLEIEDFSDPNDFLVGFLRGLFYAAGKIHQEHFLIELGDKLNPEAMLFEKIRKYTKYLNITPQNWALFIYSRNGLGECSGIVPKAYNEKEREYLCEIINTITKTGFKTIIIDKNQKQEKQEHLPTKKLNINKQKEFSTNKESEIDLDAILPSIEKIIQRFAIINPETIIKYLHTATLFRQSRSFSALLSEAFISSDLLLNTHTKKESLKKVEGIILTLRKKLEKNGLFVRKPGGHIWTHRNFRIGLQEAIEKGKLNHEVPTPLHLNKAQSHFWIADWYFTGFLSTANPIPLTESLYHWFSSIRTCLENHKMLLQNNPQTYPLPLNNADFINIASSLAELSKAIRLANTFIKHWMYDTSEVDRFKKTKIMFSLGLTTEKDYKKSTSGNSNPIVDENLISYKWRISSEQDKRKRTYISCLVNDLLIQSRNIEVELKQESGSNIIRAVSLDPYSEVDVLKPQIKRAHQDSDINLLTVNNDNGIEIIEMAEIYFKDIFEENYNIETPQEVTNYNLLSTFKELFSNHIKNEEIETEKTQEKLNIATARSEESKENIMLNFFDQPYILISIVKFYCKSAYIILQWIKILEKNKDIINKSNKEKDKKLILIYSSFTIIMCNHCLRLLRIMPPRHHHIELSLKPELFSLLGLGLAYKNQFQEAHRAINTSISWNFNGGERESSYITASITIRRAEIHLLQAKITLEEYESAAQKGSPLAKEKYYLYITKLNDAFISIEKAEQIMQGANQSSLWWGRLNILKLELYANYNIVNLQKAHNQHSEKTKPLIYSGEKDYKKLIAETFTKGMLVASHNPIQKIFLTSLFLSSCENIGLVKFNEEAGLIKAELKSKESETFLKEALKFCYTGKYNGEKSISIAILSDYSLNTEPDFEDISTIVKKQPKILFDCISKKIGAILDKLNEK